VPRDPNCPRHQSEAACVRRIERFLEPCLLLILHSSEAYGYELLDKLNEFGFEESPADLSTVYRVLRYLEERELVISRWDTEGGGPARHLYQITSAGDEFLAQWVGSLRQTDRILHHFLKTYDVHMREHVSSE
jgi:poly-beta-hydroxybutyrate-responsive repressor